MTFAGLNLLLQALTLIAIATGAWQLLFHSRQMHRGFDPERRAILLVAGDKAGNWRKWYRLNIPIADDRFDDHVAKLKGQT